MDNSTKKEDSNHGILVPRKAQKSDFPLVYITNNSAPPKTLGCSPIDPPVFLDSWVESDDSKEGVFCPDEHRRKRFSRLNTVKTIYTDFGDRNRTNDCLSLIAPTCEDVSVMRSLSHLRNHYKNLTVCGSVWGCPLCAPKITERRSKEVSSMADSHKNSGGKLALVTFTIPHGPFDDLNDLVINIQEAMNRTSISKPAKRLKKSIGQTGYIRVREITRGLKNGWHPHIHMLVFYSSDRCEYEILNEIKNTLYPVWADRCVKLGLGEPSFERGLDVRNGMSASEYITKFGREQKWGLGRELTKGHIKKGKNGSVTPFDLIDHFAKNNDSRSALLFNEYYRAHTGKKLMTYSKDLKRTHGFDDSLAIDNAHAQSVDDDSVLVGRIFRKDWSKVVKHKAQFNVLRISETSFADAQNYIDSLT